MHVHPRCDCSLDRGYSRPTEGVPVERQQTGLQRAREGLRATSAVVDLSEVGKMRSVWHCGMLTRNNFSCCRGGIAGDAVAIKTWPRTEAPQSCLNVCPSSAVQGRHSPFLPKRVSFSPPCAYFYPSRLGCVMCTCLCQASQQNWARGCSIKWGRVRCAYQSLLSDSGAVGGGPFRSGEASWNLLAQVSPHGYDGCRMIIGKSTERRSVRLLGVWLCAFLCKDTSSCFDMNLGQRWASPPINKAARVCRVLCVECAGC